MTALHTVRLWQQAWPLTASATKIPDGAFAWTQLSSSSSATHAATTTTTTTSLLLRN
jgi:hypothetical protein